MEPFRTTSPCCHCQRYNHRVWSAPTLYWSLGALSDPWNCLQMVKRRVTLILCLYSWGSAQHRAGPGSEERKDELYATLIHKCSPNVCCVLLSHRQGSSTLCPIVHFLHGHNSHWVEWEFCLSKKDPSQCVFNIFFKGPLGSPYFGIATEYFSFPHHATFPCILVLSWFNMF